MKEKPQKTNRVHFPYRLTPAQVEQVRLLYEEFRDTKPPEERRAFKEFVFAEELVALGIVAFRMRHGLPTK